MSDPSQTSTSVSVTADEDAIPDEASIPVRLVLDARTFDQVVDALESPTAPTPALRALMRGRPGDQP